MFLIATGAASVVLRKGVKNLFILFCFRFQDFISRLTEELSVLGSILWFLAPTDLAILRISLKDSLSLSYLLSHEKHFLCDVVPPDRWVIV